mmetsp:Transcript_502/g.1472  ORF Transcript_502/g.1472 Transcript_502/m.1472 type:complete len:297 (+) Transcript_502:1744-2634(+)
MQLECHARGLSSGRGTCTCCQYGGEAPSSSSHRSSNGPSALQPPKTASAFRLSTCCSVCPQRGGGDDALPSVRTCCHVGSASARLTTHRSPCASMPCPSPPNMYSMSSTAHSEKLQRCRMLCVTSVRTRRQCMPLSSTICRVATRQSSRGGESMSRTLAAARTPKLRVKSSSHSVGALCTTVARRRRHVRATAQASATEHRRSTCCTSSASVNVSIVAGSSSFAVPSSCSASAAAASSASGRTATASAPRSPLLDEDAGPAATHPPATGFLPAAAVSRPPASASCSSCRSSAGSKF